MSPALVAAAQNQEDGGSADDLFSQIEVQKEIALAEQSADKLERDNEMLSASWYQSVAALDKSLQSLGRFDCNVVDYEMQYILSYIKSNERDINIMVTSLSCGEMDEATCLKKAKHLGPLITEKKSIVERQNKVIAGLLQKQSECKVKDEADE